MKRAELDSFKKPFAIKTYDEIPTAPPDGVVVKTSYCGVCHSDVHLRDGKLDIGGGKSMMLDELPGFELPVVLGHEIAGVIHSVGEGKAKDKNEFQIGDRVIVYPWIGCNNCGYCDAGNSTFCSQITTSLGCGTDGGYSEYVVVNKTDFLVKVSEDFPLDLGCTLACSALTGYHAVSKVEPVIADAVKHKGNAALLIIGAGGLGLWCLQTARALLHKNTKIVIADITEQKLQNAKEHGADDVVLWEPHLSDKDAIVKAKAKGFGGCFDAVIDFVNTGATSSRGLGSLAKGGALALVGLYGGSLEIPLPTFTLSLFQIHGVYVGSVSQLRELVDLVERHKLKPPELTHVRLQDVQEIVEKLRSGEITGRAIIKF